MFVLFDGAKMHLYFLISKFFLHFFMLSEHLLHYSPIVSLISVLFYDVYHLALTLHVEVLTGVALQELLILHTLYKDTIAG